MATTSLPFERNRFLQVEGTGPAMPVPDCFGLPPRPTKAGRRPLPRPGEPLESCEKFRATEGGKPVVDLLQMIHLNQAIEEEGWDASNWTIAVDHKGAHDVINGCTTSVIFPRSLVAYCSCGVWNEKKTTSFYFSGNPKWNREWVKKYSHLPDSKVIYTGAGRFVRKKTGLYDYHYYNSMRSTKFALAPDGDFAWTYRFMESTMCGAIPVIPKRVGVTPEQEVGVKYCIEGTPCEFMLNETARQEAAFDNWRHFIRMHSFAGLDSMEEETRIE